MSLAGLVAVGATVGLLWTAVLLGARKTAATTPFRIGPADPAPDSTPSVVVVVPARDEAGNIEACLAALDAQTWPHLRVVVLDDGSTDGTTEILRSWVGENIDLHVVYGDSSEALPEGWLGKPWACQRAVESVLESRPDYLLFIDADVRLAPSAVAVALGYSVRHRLDLLSVMGRLAVESAWEAAVQPAIVGLILAGNDLRRINDPDTCPERPLANGQFLLFRTEAWAAIGGHEAVKGEILDDVGLASAIVKAGCRYHIVFGPRVFSCRMYTGLGELWQGWTKNLFIGMGASWGLVVGLVGFVAVAVWSPWFMVPVGLASSNPALVGVGAWGVVGMLAVRVQLDRRFHQPSRGLWLLPVGWALVAAIAVASGLRHRRGVNHWKGRVLPGA